MMIYFNNNSNNIVRNNAIIIILSSGIRYVVSGIFIVASLYKIINPYDAELLIRWIAMPYGVTVSTTYYFLYIIIIAELAIGAILLIHPYNNIAYLSALLLLGIFTIVLIYAYIHNYMGKCGCIPLVGGNIQNSIVRNIIFIILIACTYNKQPNRLHERKGC